MLQLEKYNPNQPRDERGRWTRTGSGPITVYHGTSSAVVSKILKEGLLIEGPHTKDRNFEGYHYLGKRGESVYVAYSKYDAGGYAQHTVDDYVAQIRHETGLNEPDARREFLREPVVLTIAVPADRVKDFVPDEKDFGSLRTTRSIPPEWIVAAERQPLIPEGPGPLQWTRLAPHWEQMDIGKADDAAVLIYLVLFVDTPDDDVSKYSPNQPRHPKGTPEGGQFMSTGAGGSSGSPTNYTRDDLRNAGIQLNSDAEAKLFNERIGSKMTPKEFYEGMTGHPYVIDGQITGAPLYLNSLWRGTDADGKDKFDLTAMGNVMMQDETGAWVNAGSFRREFEAYENSVYHASFELYPEAQGHGIAKRVLGSQMSVYERLGVHQVTVGAGLSVGGYAWLKFGFTPSGESWDAMRTIGTLRYSIDVRKNEMGATAYSALTKLLDSPDPRSIWAIADSPIGRELFLGSSWNGSLTLSDQQAMARFNAYVGRTERR